MATIYLFMGGGAFFLTALAYISESKHPFGVLGFPKISGAPLPSVAGATYGFAFLLIGFGILSLTFVFSVASPFLTLSIIELYILYGIFAPLAEDTLFQSTVLPLLTNLTNLKTIGIALVAAAFASGHYLYFGGSLPLVITSFIFYIGAGTLTLYFRSALPAMAAHITFNILTVYLFLMP